MVVVRGQGAVTTEKAIMNVTEKVPRDHVTSILGRRDALWPPLAVLLKLPNLSPVG